jgi:hypothetical protein
MTWTYNFTDTGDLKVWDHDGNHVGNVENDGSGIQLPDDVQNLMAKDANGARMAGDMVRWREIHIRLAGDDLQESDQS